jgi:hypothetical protein
MTESRKVESFLLTEPMMAQTIRMKAVFLFVSFVFIRLFIYLFLLACLLVYQ